MSKYSNYVDSDEEVLEKPIDFVSIFFHLLSYWKWFVASVVLCLILGVLYLKRTTPIYEVRSTVLIKDDAKGGNAQMGTEMKSLGLFNVKNNVDNEIEVLKTSNLTEQVIRDLSLHIKYIEKGVFRDRLLYGNERPIQVWVDDAVLDTLQKSLKFNVTLKPHDGYVFTGTYQKKNFEIIRSSRDTVVQLPFCKVYFKKLTTPALPASVEIAIYSPSSIVKEYLGALSIEVTSKTTSVVNMTFHTAHVKLGKDFLNKLVEVYNREDMRDQNLISANTGTFINDRLVSLTQELDDVESKVENYKKTQGLTDIKSEADLFIKQSGDFEKSRLDVEIQLAIVSDIDDYINKKDSRNQLLPFSGSLQNSSLTKVIEEYNQLLLERKRLTRTASPTNQTMLDMTDQIDAMFATVKASVKNEKRRLQITRQDLMLKSGENTTRIKEIPRQEREYTEIKRQQIIKENLFIFLLQKKEQNFLNMSGVVPKAKLIDKASGGDSPVSPKSVLILFIALLIGFILPIVVITILDLLRFQIQNKDELEAMTEVTVLGEIPKSLQTGNIIIQDNSTNRFTEMFRLLRANLLFVLNTPDKKVINVVSSVGGEGKTFISINLGISLAMLSKKVLIIGLDVRKPKLAEYLGINNVTGITLYLSGNMGKDKLIRPSGVHPNLSIITAGPVPPNPNEMMSVPMLDELIAECRQDYDYIILDTAPLDIVSDTFALNRFADISLYVVRAEYTPKRNIEDATKLFRMQKVKNMYFVLNASDYKKSNYRYGYGQKYGYGYGNKYGSGYGYEEEVSGKQ
ncbi:MAG: polysaccharide biosynthesis tyrosine autokinase [Paludibacter sp.]